MKHLAWLVVAVALAACTDFESIQREVCGNGLLEAGEDCDSEDASCVSCSVTCATVEDCPTTDYTCGIDGLCHAPGGVLGQRHNAGVFSADELRIADVDHDGIGDAFGLSRTSLVVAHGDESGGLEEISSYVTPTQTGLAAFGDLDRDGTTDVTLTTLDGLVSFASTYRELAPVPINGLLAGATGQPLDFRRMFFISRTVLGAVIIEPNSGAALIAAVDMTTGISVSVFEAPCAPRIGAILADAVEGAKFDVYNVSKREAAVIETVVAITAGTGGSRKLCVISIHRDAPNLFTGVVPAVTFLDITPLAAGVPVKDPLLADVDFDADRCPGLVIQDLGLNALDAWEGEMISGRCGFKPANPPQNPARLPGLGAGPMVKLLGRAPVDPGVPFVAGDGLVTTEGVFPYITYLLGTYFRNVYIPTRKISQFATGDFDGDGGVDAAVASEGEEDIDVLLRIGNEAGFSLYRIDTATTVALLTSGDLDGNGVDDLAYAERFDDHDRLMVVWGTRDRPEAPQTAGTFNEILRIDHVSIRDTIDYIGVSEDLIVFQPPAPGQTLKRATLLHGSPQRTLLSYFDPRLESVRGDTVLRGSVIGNFKQDSGDTFTDLIAIAPPESVDSTVTEVLGFRVPGTPTGLDVTETAGIKMSGLADCSLASSTKLCLDVAGYLAFPVADNHDVMIGIDRSRNAVMVDPWLATSEFSAVPLANLTPLLPDRGITRSMYAVDLDGDGARELVAAVTPGRDEVGAIITCTMAGGVPQTCEDLAPAIKTASLDTPYPIEHCYDVAVGRFSHRDPGTAATATSDIVAVCRGESTSLFRIQRTAAGTVIARMQTVTGTVTAIRAGDVTGDQVDDILLLEGEGLKSLAVYPQCTNRDVACLGGKR